eukprot:COSAG02_NODE_82807_length_102_cov_47.333333_1_plen_21_part_10
MVQRLHHRQRLMVGLLARVRA